MSIVTIHNLDCEFDGNGNRLEHSDESDIPLYQREIFQNSTRKNNPAITSFIQGLVHHVLCCENVIEKEVAIALVSKNCIRQYNAKFRAKDFVTDVLSFSASDMSPYKACENYRGKENAFSLTQKPQNLEHADNFHAFAKLDSAFSDEMHNYLGDILVCYEHIIEQAQAHGEVFERELARVIIHAVLHLLGYTHTSYDMKRDSMLKKQEHILRLLVVPKIE